jgi:hypothetical protein
MNTNGVFYVNTEKYGVVFFQKESVVVEEDSEEDSEEDTEEAEEAEEVEGTGGTGEDGRYLVKRCKKIGSEYCNMYYIENKKGFRRMCKYNEEMNKCLAGTKYTGETLVGSPPQQ